MIRRLDVKIVLTLVVIVLIPLGFSVYLVSNAVDASLRLGVNAEIAAHLEHALETKREYIEELKKNIKLKFAHLCDSHLLAEAVQSEDKDALGSALRRFIDSDPSLRKVRLTSEDGNSVEVDAADAEENADNRTLPMEKEVALGSYNKIEAYYAVDETVLAEYKQAGDDFATYMALVKAPPDYLGSRFLWVYLAILGTAVILSIAIGILWARRLARRIHRLSKAQELVAEGDLSVRVDPGAKDEVGRLVESFNGMVAELAVSRARIEYLQKISAWQEMARRLAHEIKNPLTPIQLAAQQLKEKYKGEDEAFGRLLSQSTEIISEEVATLRRLTSDFSSFAKLPEIRPEPVDLAEFLEECEASISPIAESEEVAVTFSTPTNNIPIHIDRIMMKRVIDNLIRNAMEALESGAGESPRIAVSAVARGKKKHSEVEIRIEDNGPGVRPEHHPSIFDPYFTTKSEGTGLGLAISKKIVLEHGGRIWLDESDSGGALFIIILPSFKEKSNKQ